MDQTNPVLDKKEEISLREIILKLREWVIYLLKQWKIIVICGLGGAALGFGYAYLQKPRYIAGLSFILEDSKSSTLGAAANLASQFGLDLGGSSANGAFSGDNIIEFLRSRLMIEKALLTKVNYENKQITLAELYLKMNNIRGKWDKNEYLKKIQFPPDQERTSFSLQQDSVLNVIYTGVLKKYLAVGKPDKKLSFISVTCTSPDEFFSKNFTERLVLVATDFYVTTKTKRSKANVDKLQDRADSLEILLNRKTYAVAATQDLNQNPARRIATVGAELETRDKVVLQTMYGEIVKNLEMSKMAMAQDAPIFQIVDTPILPLRKEKFGKLKGLVFGGFIGGFLILGILILRKTLRKIMSA